MEQPKAQNDDTVLVGRILGGDEEAFAELMEKYQPRLFRLVHGIVGDWQRSEDACQEVFVNAYLKLHRFQHRSLLSTWLYRLAVNAALKVRGKPAYRREIGLEAAGAGPTVAGRAETWFEGKEMVGKLLRPLPPHLRAAVLLKEQEGLSYAEISRVLKCTHGAVEQRLHRAFCMLREIWKDRKEELGLER